MSQLDAAPLRDRPATIYDVADHAGVSAQTVSRLIKGYEGIRPKTREKVEAAIAELGYRPNHVARLLRTQKSTRIGVVVHEMFEYGPARLLRGAASRARLDGYSLSIVGVDGEDEKSIEEALDTFDEERVAGILAITLTDSVRTVVERRVPKVPTLIDPAELGIVTPATNEIGGRLVADHFLSLGHKRVGLLLGPEGWLPARQRRAGFVDRIRSAGGDVDIIGEGDWSPASGAAVADRFDVTRGLTAVFVANDSMAIGFLRRLSQRGVSVPNDLSVAGFDNIPESEFVAPSLTTVQADWEGQGVAAVEALLFEIGTGPSAGDQSSHVQVVARDSSGPAV